MARLYADENFPYPAVEALRLLGHDVLTAQELDRRTRESRMRTYWLSPFERDGWF